MRKYGQKILTLNPDTESNLTLNQTWEPHLALAVQQPVLEHPSANASVRMTLHALYVL